jgi:hypothetical protein
VQAAARLNPGKPAEARDSVLPICGGSIQGVVRIGGAKGGSGRTAVALRGITLAEASTIVSRQALPALSTVMGQPMALNAIILWLGRWTTWKTVSTLNWVGAFLLGLTIADSVLVSPDDSQTSLHGNAGRYPESPYENPRGAAY